MFHIPGLIKIEKTTSHPNASSVPQEAVNFVVRLRKIECIESLNAFFEQLQL